MKLRFATTPTWLLFFVSVMPIFVGEVALTYWSLSILVVTIFFSFWVYSVAKELTAKNRYSPKQEFRKFRGTLIFVVVYVTLVSLYFYFHGLDTDDKGWILFLIMVGQMILFYCFIYLLAFVSKAIATVMFQRPAGFSEFAGFFFCLFFFPVGIWWVNAKIRNLLAKTEYELN